MVIRGIPDSQANAEPLAAQTLSNTEAKAGPSTRPTSNNEGGDMADEAPVGTPTRKFAQKSKQEMYEKGLYDRHPLSHPLLKDFAMHLQKDKKIRNYKQEVRTNKCLTLFLRTFIRIYMKQNSHC